MTISSVTRATGYENAGRIFGGDVWTDQAGQATVVLPAYVREHYVSFTYELTPADPEVDASVVAGLLDGRFAIETSRPHTKVIWRVTALPHTDRGG